MITCDPYYFTDVYIQYANKDLMDWLSNYCLSL